MPVILVFALLVFCLVALIAVALCMAASLGDEIAERSVPKPADAGLLLAAIDDMGEELEAVVFPQEWAA